MQFLNVSWATPFHFSTTNLSESRMLSGTRLLTLWPITSQMCSIGFKSGNKDGHGRTFIRLAWRRALVARAVCEGAPSCINLILPLLAHLSRRLKGELIVYRSIRRPLVLPCVPPWVNIFKLEYLRNQWANRNQILSEASLGWGIDCIRFWTR